MMLGGQPQAVAGLVAGIVQQQHLLQQQKQQHLSQQQKHLLQQQQQEEEEERGEGGFLVAAAPPAKWIQQLCIASFSMMSKFSAQVGGQGGATGTNLKLSPKAITRTLDP
jgi:hypothetical protein